MYRALEAGLVQMAGVEEGSREELLRRVACAEEGAVVMKVRGWRVMWPARERYLSNTDSPFLSLPHPKFGRYALASPRSNGYLTNQFAKEKSK